MNMALSYRIVQLFYAIFPIPQRHCCVISSFRVRLDLTDGDHGVSHEDHANLKYKYGNRHFWCRGYYVDTVGKYETAIKEYIRNQLQEDIANDQISLKEYMDPFTGEPVK